ncbi:MAG: AAA family ATPase [Thermoflexaceae bacterium]|nr:AAA family ATPase [Thermoflexaceae bacterium]
MIQIEAIHIEEFRGIRTLNLTLGSKSFVIHGPNGSGKSGVVDAIDFALTGNIARLAGAGTGGLSVLKHGPHVYHRDDPASATVSLTVRDTDTGHLAVLTRNVKTAGKFTLQPDTPEIRKAVEHAQEHPELTLSRREIIKYIVAEPGKRAQEVQALLQLDLLDDLRKLLKTAQSKTSADESKAKAEVAASEEAMRRHLDLPSLLPGEITTEINKRRSALGLDLFESVTLVTELNAGVEVEAAQATFDKDSAIRDIQALVDRLADTTALINSLDQLKAILDELHADATNLVLIRQRALVDAGLLLVSEPACPLCDKEWADMDALVAHLTQKLARSREAAELQRRVLAAAAVVSQELAGVGELIRSARPHSVSMGSPELPHQLQSWYDALHSSAARLGTLDGAAEEQIALAASPLSLPAGTDIAGGLATLMAALKAKPDQSAAAAARAYLTIAQERWSRLRLARATHSNALTAQTTANIVYQTYCSAADEALAALYDTVEADFSRYYRQINSDDESAFKAELEPSTGKLDLLVDFYGLGMFPPAAYHSEGHQDGMGVCIYLALIKHLLGDDFRFAILDDVVMSVDSNHRRQFCVLLKEQFPNVQFIITTHDEIWARQMQSSGLITKNARARFHGWTVAGGPTFEQGGEVWNRITTDLVNDDVSSAAHKLRRYLEAQMCDLAEAIGAQMRFRVDARYELGEVLSAVKGRHGALLKKAANAANSWNDAGAKQQIAELQKMRSEALLAQEGETWAINALVHYNEWATMTKADFEPVLDAWRKFLDLFTCSNSTCESLIHVIYQAEQESSLRCDCDTYHLNLHGK